MYAFVDSSEEELFRESVSDIDSPNLILVEAELMDVDSDNPAADPERGLKIALVYAERKMPVIIIGAREYWELDIWNELFQKENVIFLPKPVGREDFFNAIKKIMPTASI
ncbi:MAG: hypothetical protein WC582_04910 [Patescibacteria group bacterium]